MRGDKIGATELAWMLSEDKKGEGAEYARLAARLRSRIDSNHLPGGTFLPSQRELAQALGISRNTVVSAYRLLRDWEYLDSRQGSGSRVRRRTIGAPARTGGRLASISGHTDDVLDLSSGALPGLRSVAEAMAHVGATDMTPYLATDGYYPAGLEPLREAVARYYDNLDLPTKSTEILITAGAQQALWLLAHCFLETGDEVLLEDPSYRGALEIFREQGARLLTTPMTPTGPDITHLDRVTRTLRPRLLYSLPTAHNPTGTTMSPLARQRLAALAHQRDLFIVDDGATSELLLDHASSPPLLARYLDPRRSATIGTLSKLFWGGIRIGWIRTSPRLVDRLTELKKAVDLSAPVMDQLVATELLQRVAEARGERRRWLVRRYASTDATLRELAPPGWEWDKPSGGAGIWVRLPGVDVPRLGALARREGIVVTAGTACSATGGFRDRLRLPFGVPPEVMHPAMRRLSVLAAHPKVAAAENGS